MNHSLQLFYLTDTFLGLFHMRSWCYFKLSLDLSDLTKSAFWEMSQSNTGLAVEHLKFQQSFSLHLGVL